MRGIVVITLMSFVLGAAPPPGLPLNIWYTQIGRWQLLKEPSGRSFLFHDAQIDGATSGRASSQVRLNIAFQNLRLCEASLELGPAPAMAGLLLQNKAVTYFFLIQKGKEADSLRVVRQGAGPGRSLLAVAVSITDTTRLKLRIKRDSVDFSAHGTALSFPTPSDFAGLSAVGLECVSGRVKVYEAGIEAGNMAMKEPMNRAVLVNLHLDRVMGPRGR